MKFGRKSLTASPRILSVLFLILLRATGATGVTTSAVHGNSGTHTLTAFYEGDSTYAESASAAMAA